MLLTYLIVGFFLFAFLDLRGVAAARKKARYQAALLYETAVEIPPNIQMPVLPDTLQRYLKKCGATDSAPKAIRMRQKGILRTGEQKKWKPWEGKAFLGNGTTPSVLWYADVTSGFLRSRAIWYQWWHEKGVWEDTYWGLPWSKSPVHSQQTAVFACFQAMASIPWQPAVLAQFVWIPVSDDLFESVLPIEGSSFTLQLNLGTSHLPTRMHLKSGNLSCTMYYEDYQKIHGILRPMQWREEVRGVHNMLFFEGRVTDLASGGAFAWW